MLNDKKILAVIPARGGSKGITKKNIRIVGGKTLLAWTAAAAKKSKYIDKCILSSEDREIIKIAKNLNIEVPFVRPIELAHDDTPTTEVLIHALDSLPGYEYIVLLQVTSPLRQASDIDECIKRCVEKRSDVCISVIKTNKSPYWMYKFQNGERLTPFINSTYLTKRRQELPETYLPNGAVYVAETKFFREKRSFFSDSIVGYKMPKESSIDIDTEFDLRLLEMMLELKTNS